MKVLVIGKAKTGTTIVAKTIQVNLRRAKLVMEPHSAAELLRNRIEARKNLVVKAIFEHWAERPRSRNALVHNELIAFDRVIYIIRDPRDEIVSRLVYYALPWSESHRGRRREIEQWLDLIRQKERNPSSLSLVELISRCESIFGFKFLPVLSLVNHYANFLGHRAENSYLLRYEDFVQNDRSALENYLGMTLTKEVKSRSFGYTRRTASLNNWKSFLLQEDIDYLRSRFGELMDNLGYTDWQLETPDSLPVEYYSGYIEKLLSLPMRPQWTMRFTRS